LREQYMPRFAGDALPSTPIGQAVAIADKLDTLVGIFGIGQPPTGDKDPFGLRRAALGVLRIAIEQKLPLDLLALLQQAQAAYPAGVIKVEDTYLQVFDFMLERLRSYYQDQGVHYDSVDAVLSCRPHSPLDADKRIRGVEAFRSVPAAVSLASANKRVHNLLKKTEQTFPQHPEAALFTEEAERQLHQALTAQQGQLEAYLQQGNYAEALQLLAGLRESVDTFFEKVMVMDENPTIRNNRLALLQTMRAQFLKIADISRLQL
jgi:glycyl-tRNA synthetase beta chain